MNASTKIEEASGLALMREPFPASAISKLPKPTKAQTDEVKADFKKGIRCDICGQWHHPKVVHLDYVGHAALTDRLLKCDPAWNWEPMAFDANGRPAMDENGGMWIKLTVCGVTRLGYGHPDGKRGGDAIKEVIGDALRNAAMRFGAALDLWHKGDLHADDSAPEEAQGMVEKEPLSQKAAPKRDPRAIADGLLSVIAQTTTPKALREMNEEGQKFASAWEWLESEHKAMAAEVKAAFDKRLSDLDTDHIPY